MIQKLDLAENKRYCQAGSKYNAHVRGDFFVCNVVTPLSGPPRLLRPSYLDFIQIEFLDHMAYVRAVTRMIKRLSWQDFEQLIDLILTRAGWARTSTLGKVREGIDMEAENLAAGQIAFVQVKSSATQAVLNDYVERFKIRRPFYARMIFAVHSPSGKVIPPADLPTVQVWTGERVAELVVRLGLGEWVEGRLA